MNTLTFLQPHVVLDQELINQKNVIVTEIDSVPRVYHPVQTDSMLVIVCHQGVATMDMDAEPQTCLPHDVALLLPHQTITHQQSSPDYRATMVLVSKAYYDLLIQRESFIDFAKYKARPAHHLTDEQYDKMNAILKVLQIVSENDHKKRQTLLLHILDILFFALTRYREEEANRVLSGARGDLLFSKFYDLLTIHHRKQHEVAWYAEQLCFTPKYFSGSIRQTTGKSAAQWITDSLIVDAKTLLRTRHDLTVQEIAFALGFTEIASFCRFFKRETGSTPKAFRKDK